MDRRIAENTGAMADRNLPTSNKSATHPFRMAVLRGFGVVLPPLLTIVFLLWMFNSVKTYVLSPIKEVALRMSVSRAMDVHFERPANARDVVDTRTGQVIPNAFAMDGTDYFELPSGQWIPGDLYLRIRRRPGNDMPQTAEAYYRRDIERRHFQPWKVVLIPLCVFIILLYLLGKFIAVQVGKALWGYFERLIHHLPIISTVYGTVKKVTDIVFADNEMEFNRVVAVEYPRQGMWSLGFVTGESLPAITSAATEPVLSILMPTSPMPATGFTISVRKSETVDLNITIDQAFQFIVSCGVVVPGRDQEVAPKEAIESHVKSIVQTDGTAIPHVTPVDSNG
ncbi:MAG: DUF502 domain-containing protein [Planctomycetota bacterium]